MKAVVEALSTRRNRGLLRDYESSDGSLFQALAHVAPVRVLARGVADAAEAALVAHTDGVLLVAELQTLALL